MGKKPGRGHALSAWKHTFAMYSVNHSTEGSTEQTCARLRRTALLVVARSGLLPLCTVGNAAMVEPGANHLKNTAW